MADTPPASEELLDEGPSLRQSLKEIGPAFKDTVKRTFNPYTRLPVLTWLPKYQFSYLQRDLVAGLTVGLTLIPQGLAYGQQAGLSAEYGLYSSFVGPIVYAALGGSRDITNGPTAVMSSLVATFAVAPSEASTNYTLNPQYQYGSSPTHAILLSLFSGLVLFLVAFFQLGFMANFISHTVITAFIMACSITIPVSQLKKLLGLHGIRREFFESIYDIVTHLGDTNVADVTLGLITLVSLFLLKMLKDRCNDWKNEGAQVLGDEETETREQHSTSNSKKYLKMTGWLLGGLRNCLLVSSTAIIAYLWTDLYTKYKLTLTGDIPAGLPPFKVPAFTEQFYDKSGTLVTWYFAQIFKAISAGILICPILAYLETYAIGSSFARKGGYRLQPEQEMYAIGTSCILTSFVSGYTITGSFSRSSINNQCEVASPLSGLITAGIIIVSLQFLTSLFYYIPTTVLAAVIILAASGMFDWKVFKHSLLQGPIVDRFIFVITFGVCLWDTAQGIVLGTLLSILTLLVADAWPFVEIKEESEDFARVILLESALKFPSVGKITGILTDHGRKVLAVDLKNVQMVDSSAALAIVDLALDHEESKLYNVKPMVRSILIDHGLPKEKVGASD